MDSPEVEMDAINALMNSLTYRLVSYEFIPHKNQYGGFMAFGAYRVLEKAYPNNVVIVKIINGDLIPAENIRLELEKSIEIINDRKIKGLKPLNLHFVIATSGNFTLYHQMADNLRILLQTGAVPMCITIVNTLINNIYTVNDIGYINNYINQQVYQSLSGRLVYDHDIETILTAPEIRHRTREPFSLKKNLTATKIFIGLNILFWFLGLLSKFVLGFDIFQFYGVQISVLINQGKQYWRFLTPIFLHANFIHMLSNSYFLFICGELVEMYIGKVKFIIFYLVTGVIGNIVSYFTIEPMTASLGASGACLGIGGVLVYMWLNKKSNFLKNYRGVTSLVIMIAINIFYGFTVTGIDNGAHVGGFLSGLILAFIVDKTIGLGQKRANKIPYVQE